MQDLNTDWTIGVTQFIFIENYVRNKIEIHHFEKNNNKPLNYNSKIQKPNILIIAGTHGDEPAGTHAFEIIKNKILNNQLTLKTGSITLIPKLNEYGIKNNKRETNHFKLDESDDGGDINRTYSKNKDDKPLSYQASLVQKYMKNADLVLDFHEGYDFHKINNNSIGSTIHVTNFNGETFIAKNIIKKLNTSIKNPQKKWTILKNKADIPASCRHHAKLAKIPHILIETTGKLDKQPLNIRIDQCLSILDQVFKDNNMI